MSFLTLSTKIKSFTIAFFFLLGSLLTINFAFATDSAKIQSEDGDSVKALKRIYSSMTKIIFAEIKTMTEKQDVENKDVHFLKQNDKNEAGLINY